jgi:hypothetical protein
VSQRERKCVCERERQNVPRAMAETSVAGSFRSLSIVGRVCLGVRYWVWCLLAFAVYGEA